MRPPVPHCASCRRRVVSAMALRDGKCIRCGDRKKFPAPRVTVPHDWVPFRRNLYTRLAHVAIARESGMTWKEIGDDMGVSWQYSRSLGKRLALAMSRSHAA